MMSSSPESTLTRSSGTKSPWSDPSTGKSTPPSDEEASKIHVTLEALDDWLLTITLRLRSGSRTQSVERAVRRYMGTSIQESDAIHIYRASKALRADDRLHDDTQVLQYRVFPSKSTEPLSKEVPGDRPVDETPDPTHPLSQSVFEDCASVAQARDTYARMLGLPDPKTVIVSLVGGLREGPLEGDSWEFDKMVPWQSEDIVVSVCHRDSYLVLRGCGKEYLYQASNDSGDGVSARDITRWLKDRVIRRVHPELESRNPVGPADISLRIDGRNVSSHTPLVPWKKVLEFSLSPHVQEAFFREEEWLDSSFECSVCGERSMLRAPRLSEGCTHERSVCTPCVRKWLSTHLTEDGWDKARCPLCCHPLTYHEIKPHVTEKVFARYCPDIWPRRMCS